MPFTENGRHAMLSGGLSAAIQYVSVHSSVPDDTGSNEIVGVTRQPVTWGTPGSSTMTNTNGLSFTMPNSSVAACLGLWSASTGGNFYGWVPVNSTKIGYAQVDSDSLPSEEIVSIGHTLVNGDQIILRPVLNTSLPGGITAGTVYYVINSGTDVFSISATFGGSAVNLTSNGDMFFTNISPLTFVSTGLLNTDTGDLSLNVQPQ